MSKKRAIGVVLSATIGMGAAAFGAVPAAQADDVRNYTVDFTNGWGVRLRQAPHIDAAGFGADGKLAMPEGAPFPGECEDYGDEVMNEHGATTDLWMRSPGGVWVSEIYLDTGSNDRVGLPLCSEKDAALRASVEPKTVADYHREGVTKVMVVNDARTSSRVYFSRAETKRAASALNAADSRSEFANSAFCVVEGGLVGLMTGGTSLVAVVGGAAAGAGTDIGCEMLTNSLVPDGFEEARGAANAAASAGKCYEVRSHKEGSTGEWVADVWTVTEDKNYCA